MASLASRWTGGLWHVGGQRIDRCSLPFVGHSQHHPSDVRPRGADDLHTVPCQRVQDCLERPMPADPPPPRCAARRSGRCLPPRQAVSATAPRVPALPPAASGQSAWAHPSSRMSGLVPAVHQKHRTDWQRCEARRPFYTVHPRWRRRARVISGLHAPGARREPWEHGTEGMPGLLDEDATKVERGRHWRLRKALHLEAEQPGALFADVAS